MTSWVSRLLPRNGRSLATASENQRAEDRHRHQEAYGYFLPIQTRWQDNDQYGHVNNVVYYSYFDTIINQYLISPSDPSGCFVMVLNAVSLSFSSPDDVSPKFELLRLGTAVS
ncbi:hypothetical protein MJG53_010618 [Ovis ammon polii x Ovis aries]|uniref:Uncharacterized protein n=1 Tax=Ovis ammon polii x Ovis aries TaxID=2918886 RepID=A0ACB9UV49_9CETA|nr:hypothetical protein MJG53_010618 [Ovis ammon polii x Ovis aries]